MEQTHILLVEDEHFLAKVVKDSLEQRAFKVTHAADGRRAYSLFQNNIFSLCIVDVMLPYTDGFTLVKQIRAYNTHIPILFLTAKTATEDIVEGYKSGGNDYLKKPFGLEELFLRVNELLKRGIIERQTNEEQLFIGEFILFPNKQLLQFRQGTEQKLSFRETQLLQMLYDHKNTLLERRKVLLTIWGDDSFFNTRTMDVFITKLRKHLKQDASVEILNIRGMGYKLIC
ncbi:two-component system response regulator TrcR [Mucilaginibacter sp. OAE612]|uniref:response regulator transcription factor n=1 Tax=Mucilaginibacter sp. OAE612 TaxID=3156444 RepID=UPI00359E8D49